MKKLVLLAVLIGLVSSGTGCIVPLHDGPWHGGGRHHGGGWSDRDDGDRDRGGGGRHHRHHRDG